MRVDWVKFHKEMLEDTENDIKIAVYRKQWNKVKMLREERKKILAWLDKYDRSEDIG